MSDEFVLVPREMLFDWRQRVSTWHDDKSIYDVIYRDIKDLLAAHPNGLPEFAAPPAAQPTGNGKLVSDGETAIYLVQQMPDETPLSRKEVAQVLKWMREAIDWIEQHDTQTARSESEAVRPKAETVSSANNLELYSDCLRLTPDSEKEKK